MGNLSVYMEGLRIGWMGYIYIILHTQELNLKYVIVYLTCFMFEAGSFPYWFSPP